MSSNALLSACVALRVCVFLESVGRKNCLPHTLGEKIERIRMKMKRTGLCKATPETIWNTCFHDVEGWPAWVRGEKKKKKKT